jgi:hypothetical protein
MQKYRAIEIFQVIEKTETSIKNELHEVTS